VKYQEKTTEIFFLGRLYITPEQVTHVLFLVSIGLYNRAKHVVAIAGRYYNYL